MKYLKYFLILLFIPFIVLAEECDISKITITSIEQSKINGNTEEISEPTIKNRNINFNLKMYDVNDSITYDLVIKNDSEENYMIDEDTFKTDSEYIEYTLKTNDNNNVVKAKSSKDVTLTVTYKKEIEDDLLSNNRFDASNSLKLSLNTSEKEKELDIITTDNIKEAKNPNTSVSSILLITMALLITLVAIYMLVKNKNRYSKYIVVVVSMLIIPTVYAVCKVNVEVKSTIEIEKLPKLYDTVVGFANESNACVVKYDGDVTDEVGKTVPATNVYFDKCEDKRNIIFGGFCWQVIRTTDTKGTKLIYNGKPVDGKCESSRDNQKGVVGDIFYLQDSDILNNEYLYGDSYNYDEENNTFRLNDTISGKWNESTYRSLIGKYTCLNQTGECTAINYMNNYDSINGTVMSIHQIDDINYDIIGASPFNAGGGSPAMVGYMFNKVYPMENDDHNVTEAKFGNSFVYNENTNMYTLSGDARVYDISNGYYVIGDNRYTCWNSEGVCSKLSYIYYFHVAPSYIILSGGMGIEEALDEMIASKNVNKYNSTIKGVIDSWYKQNLNNKTSVLESNVYCNDRKVFSYGYWKQPVSHTLSDDTLLYNYFKEELSLACSNKTDQFSTSNNDAKLIYPVSLLQSNEVRIMNLNLGTGSPYWLMTPGSFGYLYGRGTNGLNSVTYDDGSIYNNAVSEVYGIRPVISLKNNNKISKGSGSETDPWIIE